MDAPIGTSGKIIAPRNLSVVLRSVSMVVRFVFMVVMADAIQTIQTPRKQSARKACNWFRLSSKSIFQEWRQRLLSVKRVSTRSVGIHLFLFLSDTSSLRRIGDHGCHVEQISSFPFEPAQECLLSESSVPHSINRV